MKLPCTHSVTKVPASSPANLPEKVSSSSQPSIPFDAENAQPGSYDDASTIRGILVQSIKDSDKSRAEIADSMSRLLARPVTEKMLNAFTADSRNDRRWPLEFTRAFCVATGSDELLRHIVQLAGGFVITAEEKLILDLGRQLIIRSEAEEKVQMLTRRLYGRSV